MTPRATALTMHLDDCAATIALGEKLAGWHICHGICCPVFFSGELGAGKTSFIRGLVSALPGGHRAEVASPSFNLYNMYPTRPPVVHFDLYRLENGIADESLLDFLETERHLVLVEWAERLPAYALPHEYLTCSLRQHNAGRLVSLTASTDSLCELLHEYAWR